MGHTGSFIYHFNRKKIASVVLIFFPVGWGFPFHFEGPDTEDVVCFFFSQIVILGYINEMCVFVCTLTGAGTRREL